MAITRLTPSAIPGRRVGSFAGKAGPVNRVLVVLDRSGPRYATRDVSGPRYPSTDRSAPRYTTQET